MKKNGFKIIPVAFLLIAFCIFLLCACNDNSPTPAGECVRIHIRANSDSDPDQRVKLAVRDKITEYLTQRLENVRDKSEALGVLSDECGVLKQIADSALYANGFNYKSTVSVKNEYFPEKAYGEYVFPEGYYDALVIELGSGEGHNWWCVAFPPLCFVPDSPNGEKIVYKSWIKEKLESLFSK